MSRHCMDLNEFARLAQIREFLPHGAGRPIIITPALAAALDVLIGVAGEVVAGATSRTALRLALGALQELHDYETVRLGGKPVRPEAPGADEPEAP